MSDMEAPEPKAPPMRAAIVPVTPLQQNCSLVWCTRTMKGALRGSPFSDEAASNIQVSREAPPGMRKSLETVTPGAPGRWVAR